MGPLKKGLIWLYLSLVLVDCNNDFYVPESQGIPIQRAREESFVREEVPAEVLKSRREAYEESKSQYISAKEDEKNVENLAPSEVKGQENLAPIIPEEKVRRQDPDAGLVGGTVDGLSAGLAGATNGLGSLLTQTVGGVGSGLEAIGQGDAVGGVASILGGLSGGLASAGYQIGSGLWGLTSGLGNGLFNTLGAVGGAVGGAVVGGGGTAPEQGGRPNRQSLADPEIIPSLEAGNPEAILNPMMKREDKKTTTATEGVAVETTTAENTAETPTEKASSVETTSAEKSSTGPADEVEDSATTDHPGHSTHHKKQKKEKKHGKGLGSHNDNATHPHKKPMTLLGGLGGLLGRRRRRSPEDEEEVDETDVKIDKDGTSVSTDVPADTRVVIKKVTEVDQAPPRRGGGGLVGLLGGLLGKRRRKRWAKKESSEDSEKSTSSTTENPENIKTTTVKAGKVSDLKNATVTASYKPPTLLGGLGALLGRRRRDAKSSSEEDTTKVKSSSTTTVETSNNNGDSDIKITVDESHTPAPATMWGGGLLGALGGLLGRKKRFTLHSEEEYERLKEERNENLNDQEEMEELFKEKRGFFGWGAKTETTTSPPPPPPGGGGLLGGPVGGEDESSSGGLLSSLGSVHDLVGGLGGPSGLLKSVHGGIMGGGGGILNSLTGGRYGTPPVGCIDDSFAGMAQEAVGQGIADKILGEEGKNPVLVGTLTQSIGNTLDGVLPTGGALGTIFGKAGSLADNTVGVLGKRVMGKVVTAGIKGAVKGTMNSQGLGRRRKREWTIFHFVPLNDKE